MARIFPDEGLDIAIATLLGISAAPSALWVGYFTSQTATTVPAASAVLASQTGVTEASYTGYARAELDPGEWGAAAALAAGGRKRVASQQALPQAGAGSSQITANGYFIADAATGGHALCYVNFDEGAAVIGEGDTPRVTPTFGATN